MTMTEPFVDGEFRIRSQRNDWFVRVVVLGGGSTDIGIVVTKHTLVPECDMSIDGRDQHDCEKSRELQHRIDDRYESCSRYKNISV